MNKLGRFFINIAILSIPLIFMYKLYLNDNWYWCIPIGLATIGFAILMFTFNNNDAGTSISRTTEQS